MNSFLCIQDEILNVLRKAHTAYLPGYGTMQSFEGELSFQRYAVLQRTELTYILSGSMKGERKTTPGQEARKVIAPSKGTKAQVTKYPFQDHYINSQNTAKHLLSSKFTGK
jgi:hypothetical protein